MTSMRPRPAIVAAAVIGVLVVAACTTGSSKPRPGTTGSTSTSGQSSTPPTGTATSPPVAPLSVLKCRNYIDNHAPTAQLQVVLGVVALPVSPSIPALGTALTGDGSGPTRLFAKTGLVIRTGATFELVVPPRYSGRFGIGWSGEPSTPSRRVVVSHCANPGGAGWLAYPGGYWVDRPACVPLVVKSAGRTQLVHVGVGTACPGQRPPHGPTQR